MAGALIEVGDIVQSRERPDWGRGQVQSIIGDRVTVNFQQAGKIVLSGAAGQLELVARDTL